MILKYIIWNRDFFFFFKGELYLNHHEQGRALTAYGLSDGLQGV